MPTRAIAALQGWLPGTAADRRFARHVLTIACGTLAAQTVTVVAAPVLARLYPPEAFGVFGALIGFGTVLGAVAGLKYELAIILETSEADALDALRLVIAVVAIFGLFYHAEPSFAAARSDVCSKQVKLGVARRLRSG